MKFLTLSSLGNCSFIKAFYFLAGYRSAEFRIFMNDTLYTIGHSTHEIDKFLELVKSAGVNCIVDVRSIPHSAHAPQFNIEVLPLYLKRIGVIYLSFAEEFGARRLDCLDADGKVDFEKAVQTEKFLSGVKRIEAGLEKGYNIALMCSEADPLACHRFSMISRYFDDHGFNVKHILKDGSVRDHKDLLQEMTSYYVKKKKIRDLMDMFEPITEDEQAKEAYHLRNIEVGYTAIKDDIEL